MAYTLPHTAITKIPDTEPDAVPELWNDTYAEIDANFARIVGFNPVGKCLTAGDVAEKTRRLRKLHARRKFGVYGSI